MAAEAEGSKSHGEKKDDDTEKEFVAGFKDVNTFSQAALRALMFATKASNELPTAGDDYDYYSSFDSFRDVMNVESTKVLQMIQSLMRYHGAKGNMGASSESTELEDRFDTLVDANDQLLERVGTFLDEASGLKKTEAPLVVASATSRSPISGSWNKKKNMPKSSASYRLLTARNILRPQLKFKDTIDNSKNPFIPKITNKHNALRPLPESILDAQSDEKVQTRKDQDNAPEQLGYPHPYQYELDYFTPTEDQLQKKADPVIPQSIEATEASLIDTEKDLKDLCQLLKDQKEIAVDLEHHSYRTFQGITCLMQLSTRTQDFLVDTLQVRSSMHLLNEVFTDPKIVKVLHGADMDIEWLQRDFGLYIVNMFDTGQASRVLSLPRHSLAYLLTHYCQVEADKQFQLADWRIRPLPAELVKYAREDTHYLLYIYDLMKNQLLSQGNDQQNLLLSVIQRSKQICAKRYEKPQFREENILDVYRKSKRVFNSRQMAAFRGIMGWRDRMARQEDESIGYVLPNHMVLQISEVLPREGQGILACCNPIPPLVRQSLGEIHGIVNTARELPLEKTEAPKTNLKPTKIEHPRYHMNNTLHDLSQEGTTNRRIPIFAVDPKLIAESSSMYKDEKAKFEVPVKTKPSLSVFDCSSQDLHNSSEGAKKAALIKNNFHSPFTQYLPGGGSIAETKSDIQTSISTPEDSATISTPEGSAAPIEYLKIWKMRPVTAAKKTAKSKPVVAIVTEKEKVKTQDTEKVGVIPLRFEVPNKKGKKRKSEDITQSPSNAKGGSNIHMVGGEPKKKKKAAKLSVEEVEKTFKPHSYEQEYKIFQEPKESSKKKGKDYNPDMGNKEKYKGASKSRLQPSSGKKSASFGKHKGNQKMNWPKR